MWLITLLAESKTNLTQFFPFGFQNININKNIVHFFQVLPICLAVVQQMPKFPSTWVSFWASLQPL